MFSQHNFQRHTHWDFTFLLLWKWSIILLHIAYFCIKYWNNTKENFNDFQLKCMFWRILTVKLSRYTISSSLNSFYFVDFLSPSWNESDSVKESTSKQPGFLSGFPCRGFFFLSSGIFSLGFLALNQLYWYFYSSDMDSRLSYWINIDWTM